MAKQSFKLWSTLSLMLLGLLFLSGCGVYSKVPPVNPKDMPTWSGPLVENADLDNVKIYIKPNQRTIVLNMEELDGDLRILLSDYELSKGEGEAIPQDTFVEELSVNVPQNGSYVLVIKKTKP
ncbi:hypothetical protein [Sphaerochaeta sp. PS]|uniref:hypothetical protein n=1 Tax=Sphaerochaeta sp. PS TaxID=3076336 RepID=UPI0028A4ACBA|nr:hypothetical protein [Sphaerochaeta sp. PS]MDT4761735.1 hypothetical protein [Sphaerochaeta sp. PS]